MAVLTSMSFVRSPAWIGARLAMVGFFLLALSREAQAAPTREYQLKAVFLFNFAQFVTWPKTAFSTADAPLVIGVLGADPFGNALDETVRGEQVQGHPLVVRRFRRVQDVVDCQLLFVTATEADRVPEILEHLKTHSILTVGESEGFAKSGGMIRFMAENGRIRLRINYAAVQAAGLQMSSKLLRPAEIVGHQG